MMSTSLKRIDGGLLGASTQACGKLVGVDGLGISPHDSTEIPAVVSRNLSPPARVRDARDASLDAPVGDDMRKRYRLPNGSFPQTPIYSFQLQGILRLIRSTHHALLDDMGLGKTLQALYASNDLFWGNKLDKVVIVCKSSLAYVWLNEMRLHLPGASVQVLAGLGPKERVWKSGKQFYIMPYSLLGRTKFKGGQPTGCDATAMAKFMQDGRCGLILDESQAIRNPESQVSRCLFYLAQFAKWRVILTATLVADGAQDVWAQMFFLDQGALLGQSYLRFKRKYVKTALRHFRVPGKLHQVRVEKIVGYKNLGDLYERISRVSTRRRKEKVLGLPKKTIVQCPTIASSKQRVLCCSIRDELVESLKSVSSGTLVLKSGDAPSTLLNRIQRASAMPSVLDPAIKESIKMQLLLDRLASHTSQAVVWCYHRNVCEAVTVALNKANQSAVCITGSLSIVSRAPRMKSFMRGDVRILVATMDSTREGHNLVNASYAFYFQLSWHLLNWTQSQDRIYRIGQSMPVTIDVPLLNTSIDEYMFNTVLQKEANASSVTDGTRIVTIQKKKLVEALKAF